GQAVRLRLDRALVVDLGEIHRRVAGHRERQPRPTARGAVDPDQDQRAGVQHRGQRRQPGLAVVLGAEVAEQRVGEVALQHLGRPALPLAEQLVQRLGGALLGAAAQELHAAGGRAGAGVEQRDAHLAARERLVEDRHVTDHQRQEQEAGAGLRDRDRAPERVARGDVPVAEGEERLAAVVEERAEVDRLLGGAEAGAQTVLEQREADDQQDRPEGDQADERERAEEAQVLLAGGSVGQAPRAGRPGAPGVAVEEARQPQAAADPARQDDRLERLVQDEQDEQQAGDGGGNEHTAGYRTGRGAWPRRRGPLGFLPGASPAGGAGRTLSRRWSPRRAG